MANGDKPPGWKPGDPVPPHKPEPTPKPDSGNDDDEDGNKK